MKNHCTLRTVLTLVLISASKVLVAQIPNAGFEYWNGGNANFWHSTNSPLFTYITPSDTAHENMYGLRSSVVTSNGFHTISPVSSLYVNGSYFFPCDCRPDALRFWYILHPTGGEGIIATVSGKQGSLGMAGNSLTFTTATDVYTEAILPIYYTQGGNADSMSIMFSMSGFPGAAEYHPGAYYIIDDLSFGSATGVTDVNDKVTSLENVYPVPAAKDVAIVYSLAIASHVRLVVHDALGRLVMEIVNAKQSAGRYKAMTDLHSLPNGLYTVRLEANGLVVNKQFAVSR